MQLKANGKQAFGVLALALVLIALCLGGLWAYVQNADAETGVTQTAVADIPAENEIRITWEKYDNYPVDSGNDVFARIDGSGLGAEEIRRLPGLKEEYEQGRRPDKKVPTLPGEEGLAVVPLNPKAYGGLTEYYILPEFRLSDEQLLMLIDYCAGKGATFEAGTTSWKNCMRGGLQDSNRYLSAGESERRDILLGRVRAEGLRPASPEITHDKLPVAGAGSVRLNGSMHRGRKAFHFYPIRELTDDELLQSLYLDYMDGYAYLSPTRISGLDPVADEAAMRSFLAETMGMPMAAENTDLFYRQKTADGEIHLHAYYKTALINGRETKYTVILQKSSGDILYASGITSNLANPYTIQTVDPPKPEVDLNDPKWEDIARETVAKLTQTPVKSVTVYDIYFMGDDREPVIQVDVNLDNGSSYVVFILLSTEKAASIQYLHYDLNLINETIW